MLCGSLDHWKKVCSRYNLEKRTATHPHTVHFPAGRGKAARVWCLHCGNELLPSAIIHLRSILPNAIIHLHRSYFLWRGGGVKKALQGTCTRCKAIGHGLRECMRHAPIQADENKRDFAAHNAKVTTMKKPYTTATEISGQVDTLQSQMESVVTWKSQAHSRLQSHEEWNTRPRQTIT